jgi:hypothetical protein
MIINGIGPRFRGGLCFVKLRRLLLLLSYMRLEI